MTSLKLIFAKRKEGRKIALEPEAESIITSYKGLAAVDRYLLFPCRTLSGHEQGCLSS